MKKFIFSALVVGLWSCEEVIDINLNDADARLVIEGHITNTDDSFTVSISQTTDFFGVEGTQPVDVQQVTLTTLEGQQEELMRVGEGTYQTVDLSGVPRETYTLTVQHEGVGVTTSSTMPVPIEIERLQYVFDEREFNPAGEAGYEVSCVFNDPEGEENFYRLVIYLNGERLDDNGFYLYDDKFADGNQVSYTFFDQRFDVGDTVKIELRSLDEQTYRYYEQLNELVGNGGPGGGSAAPGNPTSVYNSGALGVFTAYSRNTLEFSIIIEE